jgi:hypothetical protein
VRNLLHQRFKALRRDFARLDRKYGNDWTEWADVRESLAAVAYLMEGDEASAALSKAVDSGNLKRIAAARARLKKWLDDGEWQLEGLRGIHG